MSVSITNDLTPMAEEAQGMPADPIISPTDDNTAMESSFGNAMVNEVTPVEVVHDSPAAPVFSPTTANTGVESSVVISMVNTMTPGANSMQVDAPEEVMVNRAGDDIAERDVPTDADLQVSYTPPTTPLAATAQPLLNIEADGTHTPAGTPPATSYQFFVVMPTSVPFTPTLQADFPWPEVLHPISARISPFPDMSTLHRNLPASPSISIMPMLVNYESPSPVDDVDIPTLPIAEQSTATADVSMEMSVDEDEDDVEVQ
jgi:hypothetical protein